MATGQPGRVAQYDTGLCWRVLFPVHEHAAATSYLRELAASDRSSATLRSYASSILRWLRFLDSRCVGWERAERFDVRAFVEHLREAPRPRPRRREAAAAPAGVDPGGDRYAAGTLNHQLSVLFGFTSMPAPRISGRW